MKYGESHAFTIADDGILRAPLVLGHSWQACPTHFYEYPPYFFEGDPAGGFL